MDQPDLHRGSCLCGAVSFEVAGPLPGPDACHCTRCRKVSGHYLVSTDVPKASVTVRGQERITWYASSEKVRRGFCGTCGTPLSFAYVDSKRIDVSVGSLDDPSLLHPVSHFAVESRIENWHADDGLPGDRLDASEKLNARWKANYGDDVLPGLDAVRKNG